MKKRLSLVLVTALLPLLAACGHSGLPTAPTLTPTTGTTSAEAHPTRTPRPRRTPTTEPAPSETTAPVETPTAEGNGDAGPADPLAADLQATVEAGLPATATPGGDEYGFQGFDGVSVLHIDTADGMGELWAAYTYGGRSFDPLENHFVAVYSHEGGKWRELDRVELEDPDYLDKSAVEQVPVEPENSWLQVEGAAGAHAGCFSLLRFDGQALHNEVSYCNSSPGAGRLSDLNGDGTLDVLLDTSDNYVFCYACNVDYVSTLVQRWDGSQMVDVELEPLPESAPEELRRLTDRAVELARHDLWKDAQATIDEAAKLNSRDETYTWDAALINLDATNRAEHIQYSGFPLVSTIFYGDYPAVLNAMRGYTPEELFNPNSSFFTDTPAEGYIDFMTDYLTRVTTLQVEAMPDLAGAYFVRGWSLALLDPKDANALADLQKAAGLDPSEALFTDSLAYLKGQQ